MTMIKIEKYIPYLNILAIALILITIGMIFFYAPVESNMGNVHRLLYFHVGSAWVAAVAFAVALVTSIWYLVSPKNSLDTISVASIEIGVIFLTMATASGSIWGRPVWLTWWIWSPRLTSVTVAWLVYVAYFMLRGALTDEEKRKRFAAVYAIIAFMTIIFAYVSIRILRDIHPVVFGDTLVEGVQIDAEGGSEFENGVQSMRMGITMTMATTSFTALYVAWLANRLRLQRLIDQAGLLKMRVAAHLQGSR